MDSNFGKNTHGLVEVPHSKDMHYMCLVIGCPLKIAFKKQVTGDFKISKDCELRHSYAAHCELQECSAESESTASQSRRS